MRNFIVTAFLITLFNQACFQPPTPAQLNDGIKTGSLKNAGLDEKLLNAFTDSVAKAVYTNIHSVLILKNGVLVYEQYWPGNDEVRGKDFEGVVDHHRDSLHDIRSVTKSIVSAAIMIAIRQGKIKSVNQRLFEFFPEYSKQDTGLKRNLTIETLLNMSVGLEWDEETIPYTDTMNSELRMNRSPNAIEFFLSQRVVDTPGKKFNYNGGCPQMLAAIIEKVSGTTVDKYTEQYLFKPLGIENYIWVKSRDGKPSAASGLRLRSRDLTKFGLLYLQNGKWMDQQIIPSNLVEKTLSSQITTPFQYPSLPHVGYSNQFWILSEVIQGDTVTYAQCQGNGGQLITIERQSNLVLVITAGNYNKNYDDPDIRKSSWDIFPDVVYPVVKKSLN